ncbi:MAG TPA: ROK family transcriptional regulator [Pseudonocardia sp.]|nr:ROK family transcriptional regulator [Pseudonocardia sp.]
MPESESVSTMRLLWLIAGGRAVTRMELATQLRQPQSSVSVRVQALLAAGVLTEHGEGPSRGGRRPRLLAVNARYGHVWAVDVGGRHMRIGAMDLAGTLLGVWERPLSIAAGPEIVLGELADAVHSLAGRAELPGRWLGVGVGLPGPVDVAAGTVTLPSRMPGWRGYPVRDALRRRFEQPVEVDNDANVLALGQARGGPPGETLVVVKAGTGIGAALVVDGRLHRGRAGVAGDISHVRIAAGADHPCSCGNLGCLETVGSGAALVTALRAQGVDVHNTADVMTAAEDAHSTVTTAVRAAGLLLGEVLATVVNFANPDAVLLGGVLAGSEVYMAALRGALYERCLPLATRQLRIERVSDGADAGLLGAGTWALDQVFDPVAPAATPAGAPGRVVGTIGRAAR